MPENDNGFQTETLAVIASANTDNDDTEIVNTPQQSTKQTRWEYCIILAIALALAISLIFVYVFNGYYDYPAFLVNF